MAMIESSKHSPQVNDSESTLSDIPEDKMGEFVDRLLARVPPQRDASASEQPKAQPPEPKPETEEEGKRYADLRRLKALRK